MLKVNGLPIARWRMGCAFLIHNLLLAAFLGQVGLANANVCSELGNAHRPALEIIGEHPWPPLELEAFRSSVNGLISRLLRAQTEGDNIDEELAEAAIKRFFKEQLRVDSERVGASANHSDFLQLVNELLYKTVLTQSIPHASEAEIAYDKFLRVHIKRYANRVMLDLQDNSCEEPLLGEAVEVGVVLTEYPMEAGEFLEFYRNTLETTANKCSLEGWISLSWTVESSMRLALKPYFFQWNLAHKPLSHPYWRIDQEAVNNGETYHSTAYGSWSYRTSSRIEISTDYSATLRFELQPTDTGSSFFMASCRDRSVIPEGRLTAENVAPLGRPDTDCGIGIAVFDETDALVAGIGGGGGMLVSPPVTGDATADVETLEFSCTASPEFLSTYGEREANAELKLHFGTPPSE